jgi:hypothetical protein
MMRTSWNKDKKIRLVCDRSWQQLSPPCLLGRWEMVATSIDI